MDWLTNSRKFLKLLVLRFYLHNSARQIFADLSGKMAMRMAFSCTCQPNMNEPKAQTSRQRKKAPGLRGRSHRCITAGCQEKNKDGKRSFLVFVTKNYTQRLQPCGRRRTRMDSSVHTSVTEGDTEGKTACWNSCTKPPVIEARGSSASSSSFSFGPEQGRGKRHLSDHGCVSIGSQQLLPRQLKLTQAFLPKLGVKFAVAPPRFEPNKTLSSLQCVSWLCQRRSPDVAMLLLVNLANFVVVFE